MRVKIKDSNGVLTAKEKRTLQEAISAMTPSMRRHFRDTRVVYWDPEKRDFHPPKGNEARE